MTTDEQLEIGVSAPRRVLLFLAAAALLGAVCLLVVGLGGLEDASSDASWTALEAEVLSVRSEPREYTCGGSTPRPCVGTRVLVEYAWTVDGQRYRGQRYARDDVAGLWGEDSREDAAAFVAKLTAARDWKLAYHARGEPVTGTTLLGATVVVAGVALVLASERRGP